MAGKPMIDVTYQLEGLSEIRKRLAGMEKRAPNVQAQALNKTQTALKKYLPEQLKRTYMYKKKIQKPRQQRASNRKLSAVLYYGRKDMGLNEFDFTPGVFGSPRNAPGTKLSAKVRSDGGLKPISRAFVMKTGSKKIIMRRDGTAQLPISRVYGPSEHNMVNHVWEGPAAQAFTQKTLSEKLAEQINNQYLKKWGLK